MYCAVFKNSVPLGTLTHYRFGFAGQERPDLRSGILLNVGYRPLSYHITAFCARFRPHFDYPVGFLKNLRIVID